MILGVGYQHAAVAVDAQVLGAVERRPAGVAAVAAGARLARAGDGANLAGRVHDAQGVVTFNLSLPTAKYPGIAQIDTFVSTLVPRLQGEPGVSSAAAVFGSAR